MKYFNICANPFSLQLQNKLQKLVDKNILSDSVLLQTLPISDIKQDINFELEKYDLKIEYILLFYRPPLLSIDSHVDMFVDGTVCKSSMVIPWLCKDSYSVYWEQGDFDLIKEIPNEYNDVEYLKIKWLSTPYKCFEATINTPIIVKTDIPHGVTESNSKLLLATVRFDGNPSFEELSRKLKVE